MNMTKDELKNIVFDLFSERNRSELMKYIENNIDAINDNKIIININKCELFIDDGKIKNFVKHIDIVIYKELLQ